MINVVVVFRMKPGAKSFKLLNFLSLALVFCDWMRSLGEGDNADHLLEADSFIKLFSHRWFNQFKPLLPVIVIWSDALQLLNTERRHESETNSFRLTHNSTLILAIIKLVFLIQSKMHFLKKWYFFTKLKSLKAKIQML